MRKTLAIVVLAVAPSLCLSQDRTAEVERAYRELRAAINKHDVQAFERLLADDFVFVNRGGGILERKDYLALQKQGSMLTGGKTDILKIRIYGDTAVVTDRYSDSTSKGPLRIVGTNVLVKQGGIWKWASFQGTLEGAPGP